MDTVHNKMERCSSVCRVWYHLCIKGNLRYVYVSRIIYKKIFPGGTVVKNLPANAGDAGNSGSIPGLGISPGVGNGKPLQYPCLENSMDRGTWRATVHGVAKSQTRLSPHTHIYEKPITLIASGKGDWTSAGSREDRSGRHFTIYHFVSSFS